MLGSSSTTRHRWAPPHTAQRAEAAEGTTMLRGGGVAAIHRCRVALKAATRRAPVAIAVQNGGCCCCRRPAARRCVRDAEGWLTHRRTGYGGDRAPALLPRVLLHNRIRPDSAAPPRRTQNLTGESAAVYIAGRPQGNRSRSAPNANPKLAVNFVSFSTSTRRKPGRVRASSSATAAPPPSSAPAPLATRRRSLWYRCCCCYLVVSWLAGWRRMACGGARRQDDWTTSISPAMPPSKEAPIQGGHSRGATR